MGAAAVGLAAITIADESSEHERRLQQFESEVSGLEAARERHDGVELRTFRQPLSELAGFRRAAENENPVPAHV